MDSTILFCWYLLHCDHYNRCPYQPKTFFGPLSFAKDCILFYEFLLVGRRSCIDMLMLLLLTLCLLSRFIPSPLILTHRESQMIAFWPGYQSLLHSSSGVAWVRTPGLRFNWWSAKNQRIGKISCCKWLYSLQSLANDLRRKKARERRKLLWKSKAGQEKAWRTKERAYSSCKNLCGAIWDFESAATPLRKRKCRG